MKKKKIDIPIESDGDELESAADTAADNPVESVEEEAQEVIEEIEETTREVGDTLDHLRRLQAEFENYRKRTNRERLAARAWAQGDLVEQLLPVMDDLDRASDAVEDPESPEAKGFLLVREKLRGVLTSHGMEKIEATGTRFDPNMHEALLTEPVDADRAGIVLEELVTGYTFGGRVIRPARVKVGMEATD